MEIAIGIIAVIVLWILLTGKNRRTRKLKTEIYELVRSGHDSTILSDVYFEAALKFALESGGELEHGKSQLDTTSIQCEMNIDGTNYFIYFAKEHNGSTFLNITDADKSKMKFKERINQSKKVTVNTTLGNITRLSGKEIKKVMQSATPEELLYIDNEVRNSFRLLAKQRSENIDEYLDAIFIKFLAIYKTIGKDFYQEHLVSELDIYLKHGLRDEYKKNLF